ncbi:glycogen debranching N-terminal domain-containing protein [Microlunatus sp. GCM10028923]|uniref:glycogen debranching N-terminal domain-containing protein n=1 Tax=Microlunatus sp. GCM10028923 TaxID=3273400 RepID=UPI00360C4706
MSRLHPLLHDVLILVAAPTQVLSGADGAIRADARTAHGVLHADCRVISEATVTVASPDGAESAGETIATASTGTAATFTALLRELNVAPSPDPVLRLDRERTVAPGTVTERIVVSSVLEESVECVVRLRLAADLAGMDTIRSGTPAEPIELPEPDGASVSWADVRTSTTVTVDDGQLRRADDGRAVIVEWPITVPARGSVECSWRAAITDLQPVIIAASGGVIAVHDHVQAAEAGLADRPEPRLGRWLELALTDLDALRMSLPESPSDAFFAAGAPWYLTLFGRDSLWTARLLLPVDHRPALGTLRTLAGMQGSKDDPETGEQPGKIIHELRRATQGYGDSWLPPRYYGTIDATPLWVCLLHDTWRAGGVPDDELAALGPALTGALSWMIDFGDADGDGFLEYIDASGRGLANQGWKDSGDAVRFTDGSQADGPVALCEVQGYAYEAAVKGAELLDALGLEGGDRFRTWAAGLADRFRDAFWCERDGERYPALALDGAKRRVDSLTSNIGHLLGTGLLNADEERQVARMIATPDLDSGLGLRTMSIMDGGYSPLSYHCGSVWPHDTAIVINGLVRAGLTDYAAGLIEGLLRASVVFDQRLPELWSGEGRPVPYPAACRPQAWSAASAVTVAHALGALP